MGLTVDKTQIQSVFKKQAQSALTFLDFKQTLPVLAHLQTQATLQSLTGKLFQHLDAYCHLMRNERIPAACEHLEDLLPAELLSHAQKLMNQICHYEAFTQNHSTRQLLIDQMRVESPQEYRKLIPGYTKNMCAVTLVDARKVVKSVSVVQSRCSQMLNQRRSADSRLSVAPAMPISSAEMWRQTCLKHVQERSKANKGTDLMTLSLSSQNLKKAFGNKFTQNSMSDIDEEVGVRKVRVAEKRTA